MQSTFRRSLAAAVAVAMTATPVAAAAAPVPTNAAAKLSVARAGSPVSRDSGIAEGSTATLVNIGILAVLTAVVLLVVADDGGDDSPDSP